MTNFIFSDGRGESLFQQNEFDGFQPFSTPKLSNLFTNNHDSPKFFINTPKIENEAIHDLFHDKRSSNDNDQYKFDFDEPNRQENTYKKDSYQFFFEYDAKFEPFKEPAKKISNEPEDNQTETAWNTKEYSKKISPSVKEGTSTETYSGKSTNSVHAAGFDNLSLFQDFNYPIEQKEIPSLNHLVSLTINDGDSSFAINTNSKNLTNCKLLSNFIKLADVDDLKSFDSVLDKLRSVLSAKLSGLSDN